MTATTTFTRIIGSAAAVALALTAAPSLAQDAAEQPAKTTTTKGKKYCVRTETTGSRTTKMECKTRKAWIRENGFDPLSVR